MPAEARAIAVCAPIGVWILLYVELYRKNLGRRSSFLAASVIWGLLVTLLTEIPSLFNALTYPILAVCWSGILLVLSVPVLRTRPGCKKIPASSGFTSQKLVILPTLTILSINLLIALIAPPNNFDSMTYHMPRVMHWIQNNSIAHYPTHILRQIELNPWAEYAILHLQLLSDGDRFANLVQWFSMLGCVAGGSLIAGLFYASLGGQALTGFIVASIPMAILQSSSTQNDLVVSFWLVCFVYFGLRSSKEKSPGWMVLMSCSLGLAILTKGTAYIYALPFVLWFFAQDVKGQWRGAVVKYLLLGCIVLGLNAGHYGRNFELFHNPLTSGTDSYSNGHISIGVVVSNVARNIGLHLLTPSAHLNSLLVSALQSTFSAFGVDLDDPASTWLGRQFSDYAELHMGPSEDASGNPLHLLLYLTIAGLLFTSTRRPGMLWYSASIAAAFLLFCILLRWQPWNSRLHLPLFILFAPIAGAICSEFRQNWSVPLLVTVLSAASLPWVLCNLNRPLISLSPLIPRYPASIMTTPRLTQYVYNRPGIEQSYLEAAALITAKSANTIGFRSGGNGWEYPLWIFTRTHGLEGPRIEHVGVENVSNNVHGPSFKPDLIVTVGDAAKVHVNAPVDNASQGRNTVLPAVTFLPGNSVK